MIPAIGIGPLGASEWSTGSIAGVGALTGGGSAATGPQASSSANSFSSALTNAIGSLDATQSSASVDAEQLATGQATDPTQAVTAVENASLSMDFAAQIRNQLDTDATTIFETQM